MKQTTTSLSELQVYYDELAAHDWTYAMSDDHSIWKRGCQTQSRLKAKANLTPEHHKLYKAWADYGWRVQGTKERPKRPEATPAFRTGESNESIPD